MSGYFPTCDLEIDLAARIGSWCDEALIVVMIEGMVEGDRFSRN